MNNIIATPFVTLIHDGKYVSSSNLHKGIKYRKSPLCYKENSTKQDIFDFESEFFQILEREVFKINLELCELVTVNIDQKGKVVYIADDQELLRTYMLGFNDGLYGKVAEPWAVEILSKAYQIGYADALIGDDVMSSDYESNESILKRIKS
jgi:hypothetical protein